MDSTEATEGIVEAVKPRTFYVVCAIMHWSAMKLVRDGLPIDAGETGMVGFMPIYKTRAEAQAFIDASLPGSPIRTAEIQMFTEDL